MRSGGNSMDQTRSDVKLDSSRAEARSRLSKTLAYYISYIALGFVIGVIGPTLPGLAEQTGTRLSEISFLFTAHSLGYLFGSLLSGYLYDRTKGHPIIAASLLIMSGVLLLVPFIAWLWVLAALLFILGISEGWLDVGGNTLLIWVHGERVGPFMNGLHFFFGLGAFLSPIVVARAVASSGGIDWAYWVLAMAVFPISLLFIVFKSPEIRRPVRAHESRGANVVMVLLISLFFFLHVGSELSFGGWIYSYALLTGIARKAGAAYLTSTFWGALTLGRLLGIPVSTRLKPGTMLFTDITGCLVACGIILVWRESLPAVVVGTAVMGLSIASLFPTSINFAERSMDVTGKITSFFLVGSSVGSMFFPWLIGQFFESFGPHIMVIVILAALSTALAVVAAMVLYRMRYEKNV
jgi:FHS family Na+ dependent glucose MFS transporter 1